MFHGSFDTLRMHLSRDLLLLDILIFVKIIKEKILCVAFWNASAKGTCITPKMRVVIHKVCTTFATNRITHRAYICEKRRKI